MSDSGSLLDTSTLIASIKLVSSVIQSENRGQVSGKNRFSVSHILTKMAKIRKTLINLLEKNIQRKLDNDEYNNVTMQALELACHQFEQESTSNGLIISDEELTDLISVFSADGRFDGIKLEKDIKQLYKPDLTIAFTNLFVKIYNFIISNFNIEGSDLEKIHFNVQETCKDIIELIFKEISTDAELDLINQSLCSLTDLYMVSASEILIQYNKDIKNTVETSNNDNISLSGDTLDTFASRLISNTKNNNKVSDFILDEIYENFILKRGYLITKSTELYSVLKDQNEKE